MEKNILIIISQLWIWWWAEKVASTIWDELQKNWYNVFYITFYYAKKKYSFLWKEICLQESLSNNPIIKMYKLFKRAYTINRYVKKHNIQTCISFMEEANFPNILSKIIFWNTSKIIVSIRQSIDSISRLYQRWIQLLYKKANIIIPNSNEEADNLIKNYHIPSKKIHVIHNPINISLIQTLKTESLGKWSKKIIKDHFNFINIGRLSIEKNQKMIIESFIQFNKKYPNSSLFILWDGELKNDLLHITKHNKNIYFLWNQKNVYKFLAHADCFLFASKREGFPNAVLDAMACWVPIISTRFKTWILELIWNNENWLLIDQNDEKSFLETMEKIYLDEKSRNHYKQKSIERAKNFQIENIITNWKDIL